MIETTEAFAAPGNLGVPLPLRLHHNAWVVEDQERTRAFYEDVLGLPLRQFWIEDTKYEGEHFVLSHAMYGMADGSALAFFSMAEPHMQDRFRAPPTGVFIHIALKVDEPTQDRLIERLTAADYKTFRVEHGYCRSLYVEDPDGLQLEFTLDDPREAEINEVQARTAHDTLKRWMAGDRSSNNDWRTH